MADVPGRFNLSEQLELAQPEFAIGEGSGGLFLISRERSVIEEFVSVCSECGTRPARAPSEEV
jgi:hypothetical protein